jgi:general secretion pathway protein A
LRSPQLFSPAAVRAVYRASKGVPRLCNAIADRALLAGYSRGKRRIDAKTVRTAVRELPLRRPSSRRQALGIPNALAATLVAVGVMLGLVFESVEPADLRSALIAALSQSEDTPLPPVSATPPASEPLPTPVYPKTAGPQSAPADLRESSIERHLAAATPGDTGAEALNAMVALWGYDGKFGGQVQPRDFERLLGGFTPLRVFSSRRSTYQLWRTNLPAILELRLPEAGTRYVALKSLPVQGPAQVLIGERVVELPRTSLEQLWTGRTYYLWTNFESVPELASGMKTESVGWLQDRLTSLGYLRKDSVSGDFDSTTLDAVRGFQTAYALDENGEVGAETLIALYQALRYGAPRLTPTRGES